MNHRLPAAVVLAAVISAAAPAAAQNRPVISLIPENPARWDVSGQVGWLGGNKSEIGPPWDEWYEAASFGASLGYYWTPHVKLELEVLTSTEGSLLTQEPISLPGQPFPIFFSREHIFRSTGVAGGLGYQFLENAWFHPFVAGGLEVARETVRTRTPPQFLSGRFGPLEELPGEATERETSYSARPYLAAGFKWYVSERAFIRSDIRTSISSSRAESVGWRGGVGFDF